MRFMQFAKPLTRLFGTSPAPPPRDPATARNMGAEAPGTAAALGDGEEASRAAAVRRLPDGDALRRLAGLCDGASPTAPAGVERAARERVAQLVDAGAIDFATLQAAAGDPAAVCTVAALCEHPDYLPRAFAAVNDPRLLAQLVIAGSPSRLRQLAAQRIEDPATLKLLLPQVRGRDKSAYRIIQQKCSALRAAEQRAAQLEIDVNARCASLERHSHRAWDALYPTALKLLIAEWQAVESRAAPQLREQALDAMAACREVVAAHARRLAEQSAAELEHAAGQAAREQAGAQARAEILHGEAAAQAAAVQAAAEAAVRREADEPLRAAQRAAQAAALRQVGGLIAQANGALRDGFTGRAAGLRRAIEERLATLTRVPAHVGKQLHSLDAQLSAFKEWKEHAVAPKRLELIGEMESLIGSSEAPQALADRIRHLQNEWKTISKGIVSDSEADWQRFHQASQAAFLPCRDHFEAQAKLRAANGERRRDVLERLRAFETAQSGEHPDWRAVAVVLREARQEWRKHTPVDRNAGVALQEEFDAALGRLQTRLDAWQAHNVAQKLSLIEQARQLLAQEDSRTAVDAVKRLQSRWKDIGAARRDQEQSLWEQFREQCAAVFRQREEAQAGHAAVLEANKARALAVCETAEQAAALSGPALLAAGQKISEWRAAFEGVGDLPRADQRGIALRFERALSHCQAQLANQRIRETEQSFEDLLEAARRIQAYGWAMAQAESSVECDALKGEAERFIARIGRWPKGGAEALEDAWAMTQARAAAAATAAAADTAGRTAPEMNLRALCIRGEILADLPTPPEDQALRRDHQVQRLIRHDWQRSQMGREDWGSLALEWVRVGCLAPETHDRLLARFLRCRAGERSGIIAPTWEAPR